MLENFQKKVEGAAESYAELLNKNIEAAKQEENPSREKMDAISEGIRMLSNMAGTLDRIVSIERRNSADGSIK